MVNLNFRERFEERSPEDRKDQVKRCVSRIVVDKERGIATAYIRRMPAALPAIELLCQKQRPLTTGVVSAEEGTGTMHHSQLWNGLWKSKSPEYRTSGWIRLSAPALCVKPG